MMIRDVCPRWQSKEKNNGHIHNGKQHHHCRGDDRLTPGGIMHAIVEVVTGASRGFGRESARTALARGDAVVAMA
jgi:hypothetical protein